MMSNTPNYEQKKNKTELLSFICFWFCISVLCIFLYIFESAPIKKYELGDSDCYMRLVRVSYLYRTGRWYDPVILRSNAPNGERSHWTRPFDVLLLAGAVPLTFFTDFESALFWWGVIISPVLMLATIIALQWSTRPILEKDGPFFTGFVFICQMVILAYYQAGRPDHHSFLIFLFVLSIGFAFRLILRPFNVFLCYIAGAIGALSIWVSVESILPICFIIAMLGLLWIRENGDFARKSFHYTLALFVFIIFSIIFERPWYDVTTLQFDRLSIVHGSVLGFIALFWTISSIFDYKRNFFNRSSRRFYFVLAGAVAIVIATLICFPKFYKGPFVNVDPRIIPIWLDGVSEVQPLLSGSDSFVFPVQHLSLAVICFPFLCFFIFKDDNDECRNGWLFITLTAVAFILISLYQIRWSVYAQILLIIPMTSLMVLLRQRGQKAGFRKVLKNIIILLFFCTVPLFLGLLADKIIKRGDSARSHQVISMIQLCGYLNDEEQQRKRVLRILAHIDFGPEILYRTNHEVIGTPYHRNSPGILDTYDIMTANTDAEALKLLQKRVIDLILLCPESTESAFYAKPGQTSTFYQRLLEDMIPNWLRKVELPSDLSSSFMLFETIEE